MNPLPACTTFRRGAWCALALVLAASAVAQEAGTPASQDQKLDTLLAKQDQLLEGQARLQREVLPVDPFPNGAKGFAFNLPLAIASTAGESRMLSASLFWFPSHSQMEWVVPIWHRAETGGSDFRALLVDLQARYYVSPRRSGLYWMGGVRQAWLKGRQEDGWFFGDDDGIGPLETHSRTGLYGGVGFRSRSSRLYWNVNVALGRFFGPELNLEDAQLLDSDLLIDAEIFKFGLIF